MAESPIAITTGTGAASVASDLVSGNNYQQIKVVDGTLGSITPLKVNADGSFIASVYGNVFVVGSVATVGTTANQSVSGTVGASIIGLTPVTFSGAPSISGAVTIVGTTIPPGSVSGTVGTFGTVSATTFGSDATSALQLSTGVTTSSPAPIGAANYFFNGSNWDRVRGTISTGMNVSVLGTVSVSIIGTVPVTGFLTNQSVSGTIGASIVGQLPAGVAMIGSIAAYQGSIPWTINSVYGNISGSVAATITNTNVNVSGSVVGFQGGAWTASVVGNVGLITPVSSLVSGAPSVITGTTSVLVVAAAPSGQRNYITQLLVTNAAATGAVVNIVDNGSVIYTGYAAASGGGFSTTFPDRSPLKQPTSVLALYAASSAQASILVSASGYTAA